MRKSKGNFWFCNVCKAQNSVIDGECQYCECEGLACKRDNCSAPEHFHADHIAEMEPCDSCPLCPTYEVEVAVSFKL